MTYEQQVYMELCEACASSIRRVVKNIHKNGLFNPPLIIVLSQACGSLDVEAFILRNPDTMNTRDKKELQTYIDAREKEHGL